MNEETINSVRKKYLYENEYPKGKKVSDEEVSK
jgi:hypothetical protein